MIDEKKLIEEIKSLRVTVNGLRAGKGILREFEKQYRESILRIIEEQKKVGEWIPCSERLPEESGTYIVNAIENRIVHVTFAKWMQRLKKWNLTGSRSYWKVTAWMPLPEPYKPDSVDTEKPEWKDRMMQTFLGGRR